MQEFITAESFKNYNMIKQILHLPETNNFFENININQFFNNNKLLESYKKFKKISNMHNSKIRIINKKINKFDPNSIELYEILNTIDGLNNKTSSIYNNYINFNTHSVYDIKYPIKKELDEYKLNDLYFKINFFYNNKNVNDDIISSILQRFNYILNYNDDDRMKLITIALQKTNNSYISIYFLLYNLNRYTPTKVQNSISEINNLQNNGIYNCCSGYTSFYLSNNISKKSIVVTRIPEVLGLLTHELGHLLGYDFEVFLLSDKKFITSGINNKQYTNKLLKKLPIDCNINFSEAYNNTNTTIIHTICNSLELSKLLKKDSYELFKKLFKIEILYSIYHSAKILYWLGYTSFADFFDNISPIIYTQTACLFEYTIIRSFILLMLNDYIEEIMYEDYLTFKLVPEKIYNKFPSIKWTRLTDKVIDLIINNNTQQRKSYQIIFDKFIQLIKTDNKNYHNMEYFCIDWIKIKN